MDQRRAMLLREISTAVDNAVFTKEHHDAVRSIPDPTWIAEYQTGEEI